MTSETNVAYRNVAYRCVAAPADRSNQMAAIGEIVPGKVTKLVPFGAFVHIEEGIQSLVHISELAERHLEVLDQVVEVGDEFARVLRA